MTGPLLAERAAGVRAYLAAAGGQPPEAVEPRVAASVAHLGLAARLVSPALAAAVLHGRPLGCDLGAVRWQPALGGPVPLSLPDDAVRPRRYRRPTGSPTPWPAGCSTVRSPNWPAASGGVRGLAAHPAGQHRLRGQRRRDRAGRRPARTGRPRPRVHRPAAGPPAAARAERPYAGRRLPPAQLLPDLPRRPRPRGRPVRRLRPARHDPPEHRAAGPGAAQTLCHTPVREADLRHRHRRGRPRAAHLAGGRRARAAPTCSSCWTRARTRRAWCGCARRSSNATPPARTGWSSPATRTATVQPPPGPTHRPSTTGGAAAPTSTERLIAEELPDGGCGRVPGLGRPRALRQHPGDPGGRARPRRRGLRLDGRARHQQRARRSPPGTAPGSTRSAARSRSPPGGGSPTGGLPDGVDDVVVMLDARQAFGALAGQGLHIYWGAYLGTPDEILLAGPLDEALADRIRTVRAEARARKGWIMDTYLLRRAARSRPGTRRVPTPPRLARRPAPAPRPRPPARPDAPGADPRRYRRGPRARRPARRHAGPGGDELARRPHPDPRLPAGQVRTGGFGGAEGLAEWLRDAAGRRRRRRHPPLRRGDQPARGARGPRRRRTAAGAAPARLERGGGGPLALGGHPRGGRGPASGPGPAPLPHHRPPGPGRLRRTPDCASWPARSPRRPAAARTLPGPARPRPLHPRRGNDPFSMAFACPLTRARLSRSSNS